MQVNLNVDVHHLARVEGHGNIRIRVRDGQIEEANWAVVETPRFFEVMLKGKHFTTAAALSSRICGICSIAHCVASLEATEDAFGLSIPDVAAKLRLLAKHGETLQSHLLHLFFLAAPDFLNFPSVIPLAASNPKVVDLARRLKGLANRLCDAVAGRTTHPVAFCVGGVSSMPDRIQLLHLRDELVSSLDDLSIVSEIVSGFSIPQFVRETEFVSLKGEDDYPFIGRKVVSSDGVERDVVDYRDMTNEYVLKNGTSKYCRLTRDSFAVGPLARFNNNHEYLHPDAADVARRLGLEPICHNPFMAHAARVVECVHTTHEAIRLIDELNDSDAAEPGAVDVTPQSGEGVGAVEAPRGILYHHYRYDPEGRISSANCVIPTTQNHANIQSDLTDLVTQFATDAMTDSKLELLGSMLVRSYDPCISCSVH